MVVIVVIKSNRSEAWVIEVGDVVRAGWDTYVVGYTL